MKRLIITCLLLLSGMAFAETPDFLGESGFPAGVVVHVGCGDGRLIEKLAQGEGWIIRGLDREPGNITSALKRIALTGKLGAVSAALWDSKKLPFVDNSINVLIIGEGQKVDRDEPMRVLCPGGRVYFSKKGEWSHVVKELPGNTDEWTHALYDAAGGSVSQDQVVGPPRHLQWTAGPRWTRHHEAVSGFQTMVSSGGRVFYLLDEGPKVSLYLPSDWQLVARDAYNGKLLWKRPFKRWVSQLYPYKSGPTQMTRRMVAIGDRLFIAANLDEGVTVVDAVSGKTVRELPDTASCEEILYHKGILYLVTNDEAVLYQSGHRFSRQNAWARQKKWIRAVNPETGKQLWKLETPVAPMALAVSDRGVFFHDGSCVRALDLVDGKERFRSDEVVLDTLIATATTPTLAVYKDVVMFWGGADQPGFRKKSGGQVSSSLQTFTALSATDGRKLWSFRPPYHSTGFECPKDILVLDDLVWLGMMMGKDRGLWTGRNIYTGKVEREFTPHRETYWFHQRCHRSKATQRYVISGQTGIEFISPKEGWTSMNHWVRGACIYGVMPANGLIYQPQHPCGCYMESLVTGFNALAPEEKSSRRGVFAGLFVDHLIKGSARKRPLSEVDTQAVEGMEWPTFRHDNARSSFSRVNVATNLSVRWTVPVGASLTAMTVAGNRLFVAEKEAHRLNARDATTGKALWSFIAGARIDAPPTLWRGRVLFGSRDGYVYCLDAADGELAWRYRVAPQDRYLVADERLESVWPVHGSPLVIHDRVYCIAGRSAFLDGGMRMVCLDAKTGRKLHEAILAEKDPTTRGDLMDKIEDRTLPVANPDLFSFNGRHIFMKTQRFLMDCSRPEVIARRGPGGQTGDDAHLFVNSGFLDGSGFHRTQMLYGRNFSGGSVPNHRSARFAPAGKMLAFNDRHVFGFSRLPHLHQWVTRLEWHVFRARKTSFRPVSASGQSDPDEPDPVGAATVIHTDSAATNRMDELQRSLRQTAVVFDWSIDDPGLYVNSMVLTPQSLFIAGSPAVRNEMTPEALAAWRGKQGGILWRISTESGKKEASLELPSPPVHEGMVAASSVGLMRISARPATE